jgi:hypothetical protein
MKTSLVLCGLVFFLTLGVYAQTIISFSAGPNFPGGDLASHNSESLEVGFANTGISLGLSVEKLLYGKLGLMSSLRYQRNSLDKESLERYGDVTADPWQSWNLSVGPYLEFKVLSKAFIGVNIQGGYYRTSERTLNISGPYSIVNLDQEAAGAFSILYGLNVRYELNDHLGIGVSADYFTATQSFKAKYGLDTGGGMNISTRKYEMDMQSTNVQVRVSYKIAL